MSAARGLIFGLLLLVGVAALTPSAQAERISEI